MPGLLVILKLKLKIDVKMLGIGWDIMGLYEQNRVLVIGTEVLFYTWRNRFGESTRK
jgi:hypothetical protein